MLNTLATHPRHYSGIKNLKSRLKSAINSGSVRITCFGWMVDLDETLFASFHTPSSRSILSSALCVASAPPPLLNGKHPRRLRCVAQKLQVLHINACCRGLCFGTA